jgi:hypothetical protein
VRGLSVVGEPLAGSHRAVVVRARPEAGDTCVVVKAFDAEQTDEGCPRESAALSVLSGRKLPAPELLASVADPPVLVMADVGMAVIGWSVLTAGWFLGGALDGLWGMGRGDRAGPPRRAALLHRLGLLTGAVSTPIAPVAEYVDPALRDLATRLRATLVRDWGEPALPLPPALCP